MTVARPEVPLQIITPADVHASIRRARRSLERAAEEIVWQIEMEGWRTLGYSSWGAMREAEYGGAAFMVPAKNHPGWEGVNATVEPNPDDAKHQCEGCGQGMTGRADRRYCSAACRQRAYRRRAALVRHGIAPEDAEHVDTFSALDAGQFEDVLQQARQDDDLSAEHLARLEQEV